jgi:hypothetical protein
MVALKQKKPFPWKEVLMALVGAGTVLGQSPVPEWLKVAANVTVGVGAMFGIASGGLARR